jgi:ABC-type multidrug transport system permease subunit
MYHIDPFNYLMGALLVFTTYDKPVHCKPDEMALFQPAVNKTCGEYLQAYRLGVGAATNLLNSDDVSDCRVCQYTTGGDYLRMLNLEEKYLGWLDAGVFVAFVFCIYGSVYLMMRLRTKTTRKAES